MKTPPLLIGLALLLWGWMSGMLWIAVLLALLFEARWMTRAVLELSDTAITLFFDICLLIAAGAALSLFLSPDDPPVAKTLLVWLPLVFAPLALAQAYSQRARLPFSALARLPGMGKKSPHPDEADSFRPGFHFPSIYAGMVCIAAAGANREYAYFYPALAVLAALFLYANRPARVRPIPWAAILLLALGSGFIAQDGIQRAQQWARSYVQRMVHGPYQVRTAIGELGELKISRRILMRVALPETIDPPILLATAGYDFFDGSRWLATNSTFVPLEPVPGVDIYRLAPEVQTASPDNPQQNSMSLRVFQNLFRGKGLLALPLNTEEVSDVDADLVESNVLGSVLVEDAPGFIAYNATMRAGARRLGTPLPTDTLVPPPHRAVLEELVGSLGLRELDPADAARKVRDYFHGNFTYSVVLTRERPDLGPLEEFLTVSRSGHCEYFATAAVLLLRQAGIPARYALGYAVWEPGDADARMFLVRESHAHSWPRFWANGRWMDMDPTPPLWYPQETEPLSSLQWLWDWRADVSFAFMRWRHTAQNSAARGWLVAGAVVLAVFLAVRLARRGGLRRRREAVKAKREQTMFFGADSPFYELIANDERRTPRASGEPMLSWLARSGAKHLIPMARLHYRYRFDPRRDDDSVKRELERHKAD